MDEATARTAAILSEGVLSARQSLDFASLTELSLKKAGISAVPPAIMACAGIKKLEQFASVCCSKSMGDTSRFVNRL